jgi:hypothetical protein
VGFALRARRPTRGIYFFHASPQVKLKKTACLLNTDFDEDEHGKSGKQILRGEPHFRGCCCHTAQAVIPRFSRDVLRSCSGSLRSALAMRTQSL